MELAKTFCRLAAVVAVIAGGAVACDQSPPVDRAGVASRQPLTVAFIGDQGFGSGARAVLQLIRAEGVDAVMHQGDFDYRNDPDGWDEMISGILGEDFPYFAVVGNHDKKRWHGPDGYQARLEARLGRIRGARCVGEVGVRAACTYRGLFFIQSGIGTQPKRDHENHLAFIQEQLAKTDAIWRICTWHKNQTAMQVGGKKDVVGWGAYEACRKAGAIVATGHDHTYARTHLMRNFETQEIASTSPTLEIGAGSSFAFVSGLGGRSIRDQDRSGPWWAAVYTSDQDANFGALFCTFYVDGAPNRAKCYFKDIDGNVPDRFEIVSDHAKPGS